jgi:hypothetical protein
VFGLTEHPIQNDYGIEIETFTKTFTDFGFSFTQLLSFKPNSSKPTLGAIAPYFGSNQHKCRHGILYQENSMNF